MKNFVKEQFFIFKFWTKKIICYPFIFLIKWIRRNRKWDMDHSNYEMVLASRKQAGAAWVQAYAALIQVLATIFLLGFTAYTFYISVRQLEINQSQFELNNRPYIFVDSLKIDTNENGLNFIDIKLKNSGAIPGIVTVGDFCIQYNVDNDTCGPNLNFKDSIQNTYYVSPGDTGNGILFSTPLNLRAFKNSIIKLRLNYKPFYVKDNNVFHFQGLLQVNWLNDSYLVIRADGN